jgi:PEP-CTERM motif
VKFCSKQAVAIVFAATLLMFASVGAQAQIYFQNPDFNGAYSSQNDTNGFGLFAQAYDNFNLGAGAYNISSVEWIGSYFNPPVQGPITAWTLQLYSDVAGAPGNLLYSINVAGTAGETFLTIDNAGDPTYLYGLATNFTTTSNTTYWLSVYPDLGFPPQWGWETGTGGDGASYQCFFSSCSAQPNDLSFAVFGTAVPEPGSLILLGSGLLGIAGTLRRKLF